MYKFILILISIVAIYGKDLYIINENNDTKYVSERTHNGKEVIVIDNNKTYLPKSMLE